MKQYVQHKSGQGEKWEVLFAQQDYWICKGTIVLPKSEYILCAEEWEDVTMIHRHRNGHKSLILNVSIGENERIRFIDGPHNGPCFIVERRKS